MGKITIKDMARELNVSVSLVSKALNGYADVSEDKRMFIIEGAKKLGYFPNLTASNLARKKGNKIAILVDGNTDNNYIDETIMRYTSATFRKSEEICLSPTIMFYSSIKYLSSLEVLNYFLSMDIIGVIVVGVASKENLTNLLDSDEIKKVIINDHYESESVSIISTDNREAQYDVMHNACKNEEYKNIVYLQGALDTIIGKARNEGFNRFALENEKKRFTRYECEFDETKAFDAIVNHQGKIDVIACASDIMAVSSFKACHKLGISPLIVGFDGIGLINYCPQKIISVAQNFEAISENAVMELKELLDGNRCKNIYIDHKIIEN